MKKWIVVIIIAGLLGWAIFDFVTKEKPSDQGAEVGIEQGDVAPDFELTSLDGETMKLSDLRGKKVLLNFWATWCPPCRAEMPDMQKYHEAYGDEVVILGVNLRETELSDSNVQDFLDEFGIDFTILSDKETSVANIYQAKTLPTSYLIDSNGKIANIAVGPLNYEQMENTFAEMD